jgi:hypothetical protein
MFEGFVLFFQSSQLLRESVHLRFKVGYDLEGHRSFLLDLSLKLWKTLPRGSLKGI